MYAAENVHHMIMQCPTHEETRIDMYRNVYKYGEQLVEIFSNSQEKVLLWLLGRRIDGASDEYMMVSMRISGNAIHKMYRRIGKNRFGVG